MRPTFCKLAREGMKIPMPGGGYFAERGETVDLDNPFWKRCFDDGDIQFAEEEDPRKSMATGGDPFDHDGDGRPGGSLPKSQRPKGGNRN